MTVWGLSSCNTNNIPWTAELWGKVSSIAIRFVLNTLKPLLTKISTPNFTNFLLSQEKERLPIFPELVDRQTRCVFTFILKYACWKCMRHQFWGQKYPIQGVQHHPPKTLPWDWCPSKYPILHPKRRPIWKDGWFNTRDTLRNTGLAAGVFIPHGVKYRLLLPLLIHSWL